MVAARAEAEDTQAEASAALQAAQAKADEQRQRLSAGDATVTAAALSKASSEVDRQQLLLTAAERALAEARQAEAIQVQAYWSTALRESVTTLDADALAEHRSAAVRDIAAAATQAAAEAAKPYAATLADYASTYAQALRAAQDAGLIAGQADPFAPILADGQTLLVDGAPRRRIDPEARTQAAITDGLKAALRGAR